MTIRIANAAGFWGDDPDAPRRVVATAEVDYLTLEYLAELTMSILAHQRQKDPQAGYTRDFVQTIREIIPFFQKQTRLRIVTNAGGLHPQACAAAVAHELVRAGLGKTLVAVIAGDDLLPRFEELEAACAFTHYDNGQPFSSTGARPVCANAYLGASPIAEGLSAGARIIITGRVADASLTVGPLMFEYGWRLDDWDRLAAGTVAGHLIECGAQVTGGYSDRWKEIDYIDIGYPIAEVEPDGSTVITKPVGSGGVVDCRSIVEQLVYEIGDPSAYLTPDVSADFTSVTVTEQGPDRVQVSGAVGNPPPEDFKVSIAYPDGFTASAMLLVRGEQALDRARLTGQVVLQRLRRSGITFEQSNIECLGAGDGVPRQGNELGRASEHCRETVLRITVRDSNRQSVERFTREIAPLITSGPSGLAGYASGRASVRPVLTYWPSRIPRALVTPTVDVRSADDWHRRTS